MKCSEIAYYLKRELSGSDIDINGYSSLSNLIDGTVVFAKKPSKDYSEILKKAHNVLAIVCEGYEEITAPHIVSLNPRLDFMKVVRTFFSDKDIPTGVHPTANIEEGAQIGHNVSIGANCHIGSKVIIGDNTVILPNCCFYGKVTIGHDCYIKPGVVIGGPGFGFEYDENGVPFHFPHTGEIIIGNRVFIGANVAIDRATIDATVIEDDVKIDNMVNIAHNCIVKANTLITGGAMLGGGVIIERNVWISPNSTIHQKMKIGKNAKVGIGSVVLRNVKDNDVVFGIPAKKMDL